ncbi:MAG: aminotransferase class I/II-fold pyridoxal phosphate-dependent enzyme [Chloroflexi bacterium]|nr:MAG: aminotransferase class I/II-fold pyridoxal phosphate-dependent enzyme [Chloroflexota bacterium]
MPGFSTRAIRASGHQAKVSQTPVTVPIYQTSTFEVGSAAELEDLLEFRRPGHSYTRYSNPTHAALEGALAELEGGESALATASGMAAIHGAMMSLLRSGDEVLIPAAVYGGTVGLFHAVMPRLGITQRAVRTGDTAAVVAAIGPKTRLVWLETIANPTTEMADLAAIAAAAHEREVPVVVDNTFASPYLCNPLALGADLVVHSLTKYVGGHSDLIGGAVVGSSERVAAVREVVVNTGGNANPFEAFLALRGLRTLAVRMDRHSDNALAVARGLDGAPGISHVHYPGLSSHPQHELARRELRDGRAGGMMALELSGGRPAGERFLERLQVARHATSLAGVESLVSHPASSSHRQYGDAELAAAGLSAGMLRVSIGLEDAEDLVADLAAAAAG